MMSFFPRLFSFPLYFSLCVLYMEITKVHIDYIRIFGTIEMEKVNSRRYFHMIQEHLQVPKMAEYDILVAGGGVAGVAAALSASRSGCKTLLIEKSITLGGLATLGLVNYFEPLCNGRGRKIIGGMCEELLRFSIQYGYDTLPEPWLDAVKGRREDINPDIPVKDAINPPRYVTRFSPHIFAMSLTGLLIDHGIDLLFDTLVCKPLMDRGVCQGVIVENKTGRGFYTAKYIVDATGDADLVYRAGVPTYT
ncbi:MAG TPA: hypothetical protein DDZ89_11010, partial [Clostridiales bacterium]|nr:hypothetical protein [Clostridiales bacterium]